MGYKLAGYDHLGGVELDNQIAEVYEANHHPKYLFREDIRQFIKREDIPADLYDIDVFDGSPPCSSFSISGNREEDWGKEKHFREGQTVQRLDDLFFDFIELAGILRPKVIIGENVRGLVSGNAKAYVKEIVAGFRKIGYTVQLFLLNAASMGVPQKRHRVFFLCRRNDLNLPDIKLSFNERPVFFSDIEDQVQNATGDEITANQKELWAKCRPGQAFSKVHPKGSYFNSYKISRNSVCVTIVASEGSLVAHYKFPNRISNDCLKLIGSYPMDYNFLDVWPQYLIGMSVPPVMTAQVAHQVYLQWLSKC